MRLITEEVVKKIIKAGKLIVDGELRLPADCMLTPSAKAVVIDYKLKLVQPDKRTQSSHTTNSRTGSSGARQVGTGSTGGRYQLPDGSTIDVKPEHMTQLTGNQLVPKDDARIRLRGEIDILISELLKAQWRIAQLGYQALVDDLEDVYGYIGALSRAEVLEEPFEAQRVIGLSYDEVHEMSHHPKRFFGRGHLFNISYTEGEPTLLLNALRAQARRAELTFYEAFKTDDGSVSRPDLMEGYNRLSSIFYVLCLRAVTNEYGEQQ